MATQVRRSAVRWPGLAAFLIILALLAAFSWLLLDSILRWTFERSLGTLNGAEVNIERVEHQWVPLTIQVDGVQMTDPAEPEFNRVVIGQARGVLNWEQLLLGRIHFDDVVSTGIRLRQQRESPGEVYSMPDKEAMQGWAKGKLADLGLEMPSVDDIINRVDLKTPAAIEQARTAFEQQQAQVQAALDGLPSKEKLTAYEEQVKTLSEGDVSNPQQLQQRMEKFEQLKAQFEKDRNAVQQFQEQASEAVKVLRENLERVKAAPQQDLNRVQELMQFNAQGLGEITEVLFGEQMRVWSKYILLAYEQLAPMIARAADESVVKPQRGEGIWFSYTGADAAPDFLIKEARTEFQLFGTVLDIDWDNITHQHQQLGQPTVFRASADNKALWRSLNLNGELKMTDGGVDARQQWQLQGVNLSNIGLSDSDEFTASLLNALLDSDGSVSLRDSQLDGSGVVRLSDMQVSAAANNRFAEVVAKALQTIQRLDIQADISGAMTTPQFNLRSDLDKQLGGALKSAALEAGQQELSALRSRLQTQVSGFTEANQNDLNEIVALLQDAENREQRLKDLLSVKLQDRLQDKLKGRLKGLLGNGE